MKLDGVESTSVLTVIKSCLNKCIDEEGFINKNLLQNVFDYIKQKTDLQPAYTLGGKTYYEIPEQKKGQHEVRLDRAQNIEILLFENNSNKIYSLAALKFLTDKAIFNF